MKRYGSVLFLALACLSMGTVLGQLWGVANGQTAQTVPTKGPAATTVDTPGVLDLRGNGATTVHVPNVPLVPPRWIADFTTVIDPRTGVPVRKITLVDPETKHICVYSVDPADEDRILLRSVRNVGPDLMIDFYNGREPIPMQIENDLKRGRGFP